MEDFNELLRQDAEAARINRMKDETRKRADQERENRRILRYEKERRRRINTTSRDALGFPTRYQ